MKRTPATRRDLLTAWMLICITGTCRAQADARAAEYRVKAAYLLQFLDYVQWPPQVFKSTDGTIVIGIIGAESLASELSAATTRKAAGRPAMVRRLRIGDSLTGLHVLFVARSESKRLKAAMASSASKPLLIVTESGGDVLPRGSTINFVIVDNKVRFDVALGSATQKNLKISSRLLSVARKVLASS